MSLFTLPAFDSTLGKPAASPPPPAAKAASAPAGLGVWGKRSALSLLDQGLTAGAGFGINILLARWMPPLAYGAFTVAYTGYLFVSGFHNVLLVEPVTVIGPSRHSQSLPAYFRSQLSVHALLVGALSLFVCSIGFLLSRLLPASPLAGPMIGGGLALPFLLLLWLARRMCYAADRPSLAVLGSGTYALLVFCGFAALGRFGYLSPCTAFLLMSMASCVAAGLLLWRLGLANPSARENLRIPLLTVVCENWSYGRWLTVTTLLSWISVQAQVLLAASLLGLTAAGVLRAMQLPALAMSQVIAATMQVVLPSISKELGRGDFHRLHYKVVFASGFLAVVGCLFVFFLTLFSRQAEHLFYAGRYKSFAWLIPVLGLAPVFTGSASSFSYALRALGKSRYELLAYVLSAFTALATSALFMPRWGVAGGAASVVSSAAVLAAAVYFSYRRWGAPVTVERWPTHEGTRGTLES
jgi:O-antigen/teichoic acid export membrane protein